MNAGAAKRTVALALIATVSIGAMFVLFTAYVIRSVRESVQLDRQIAEFTRVIDEERGLPPDHVSTEPGMNGQSARPSPTV